MLPLVLYTGLAWGSGGLASKGLIIDAVDPYVVTAVPFAIAAVLAWLLDARVARPGPAAVGAGVVLGTLNTALPALFFNIGYETLPAGLLTLLLSLGPIVTAVVAHRVFADERFRPAKGVGLGLSLGGVAVLTAAPGVIEGSSYAGLGWVLAGVVLAGTTAVLARRYAVEHGARRLVAPQLTAAAVTPLVIAAVTGRALVPEGGFAPWHLWSLAAIGVLASYGGFRTVMQANQIGTTGQVSVIGYLIPIVGVAGGIVFFAERLTAAMVLGGLLILAGVAVTGRASGKPARTVRAAG